MPFDSRLGAPGYFGARRLRPRDRPRPSNFSRAWARRAWLSR